VPDDENEWAAVFRTAVDDPRDRTAPHRSLDWLAGREAGYGEGVRAAIWELIEELRRARCTDDDILRIRRRIETRALSRG
jgi:hypothetical protein